MEDGLLRILKATGGAACGKFSKFCFSDEEGGGRVEGSLTQGVGASERLATADPGVVVLVTPKKVEKVCIHVKTKN